MAVEQDSDLVWQPRRRGERLRQAFLALPELPRFLLLGGFSAGVNLVSRFALTPWTGFEWAVPLAYLIGMAVAFLLFRAFVFGASGRSVGSEAMRFTVVNIVALLLVWAISVGLARGVFPAIGFTWYAEDVAHLIGVLSPALSSWIGHKRYTFRSK